MKVKNNSVLKNQCVEIENIQTVNDMLHYAKKQFLAAKLCFGHGTDNAWDDALALVLHVLHLPINASEEVGKRSLTLLEREKIVSFIKRRIELRIPVPYLTHEAWFAELSFYVDDRVLIPRSPIAELINQEFYPWIDKDDVHAILDLGTGSACIAVACALTFPKANIDAVDIDAQALDVAIINVAKYELSDRINLIQSDLFAKLDKDKKYDVIVSNPPYVDAEDMANLPPEYHHEPKHTLDSGQDGLDHVKRILMDAADYLTENGILIVEVGNSRAALEQQFPRVPFMWFDFAHGGEGVFLLSASELKVYFESTSYLPIQKI